ncbi:MAG: 8-oxo-dGTP diphosphatase [Desulfobulbaceae bacterium]|jgi:8-oxo-dGTP diphosphatase|nr:8-oxo-dGTP diphosphatase [Desulfobulbaceae bacterium]MDY0350247.1 8-oxo-dGTP diphosphatase [Desulfobulbaceae bacterium]
MYEPVIGTLGYVLSPDRTRVLLVRRDARPNDHHLGKYNGLGGKVRADEDVLSGLTRELREEAGIDCLDVALRGTINWKDFGPDNKSWLGFIFLITRFAGEPFTVNEEGVLGWHRLGTLDTLEMWEGDRFFLPLVFDDDPRIFYGYLPYRNGRPVDWTYRRM